jgi:predicted kinase/predicted protein tyrosine phosphatase
MVGRKKLKVLCICAVGVNRSKYLAEYLEKKGYLTKYGGVDYRKEYNYNPLKQKDVDWADIIIITRKRLKSIFKKEYNSKGKKIITLDVTDSKRLIPDELSYLRELEHEEFQNKWTRPQLRKAIKPYLPLSKDNKYYLIIRGPLGCGKSTISEILADKLDAEYVAMDRIVDNPELIKKEKEEGYISQKSFKEANQIAISMVKNLLGKGKPVIFDGNFYWKSQIEDLIKNLNYPHYIFTLKAPLNICIERDKNRNKTHGEMATRVVYKKSTSFKYGKEINTSDKTPEEVANKIIENIQI